MTRDQILQEIELIPMSREDFAKIYLDWVNNFLTVDKFATYYGLNPSEAIKLIELGKSCHDLPHPDA